MLCKEKSHCFHCEIFPQATYECSREDIHHFQQTADRSICCSWWYWVQFSSVSVTYTATVPAKRQVPFTRQLQRGGDNKLLFWLLKLEGEIAFEISQHWWAWSLEELVLYTYNEFLKAYKCLRGKSHSCTLHSLYAEKHPWNIIWPKIVIWKILPYTFSIIKI